MRSAAFCAACTGPTMLRVSAKPSAIENSAQTTPQTMLTTLVAITAEAIAAPLASARFDS
jgi:hypothetical protein